MDDRRRTGRVTSQSFDDSLTDDITRPIGDPVKSSSFIPILVLLPKDPNLLFVGRQEGSVQHHVRD
jgi:hypothetical protein